MVSAVGKNTKVVAETPTPPNVMAQICAPSNRTYSPRFEAFETEQLVEMYDINVLATQRVNRAVRDGRRSAAGNGDTSAGSLPRGVDA